MKRSCAALVGMLVLAPALSGAAAIDLHAHLFMDAVLTGVFHGHPTERPAKVRSRKARFSNQVSLKDLEEADVRLVGTALYAPAVLSQLRGGNKRTLLAQIDAVEDWVKRHPRVSIVRSPEEAEAVLQSKEWRLGVILSVEGAGGADTVQRLDALWDRGVRMLTITHFKDTKWGGTADVTYWPRSTCRPGGKGEVKRSIYGLSTQGRFMLEHAVQKGLLLDLTHSSDQTALDIAKVKPALPLLFTHQGARELTPCERMISPELLREVKRSKGMVGVTVASNYVGDDMAGFLAHAKAMAREAGPDAIALGTDYNGMIGRIEGAADSSGLPTILKELRSAGIPADRSAEAIVEMWKRSLQVRLLSPVRGRD